MNMGESFMHDICLCFMLFLFTDYFKQKQEFHIEGHQPIKDNIM